MTGKLITAFMDATAVTSDDRLLGLDGSTTKLHRPNDVGKYVAGRLGVFNVLDYGAVGDGVTDDTAALTAAVAALSANGGGDLHFPDGTFVGSALLQSISNVAITFSGGAILKSTSGTGSVLRVESGNNIRIVGANILGIASSRNSNNYGIRLVSCTDFEVTGCRIVDTNSVGIYVEGGVDGRIHHNHVQGTLADGIHLTNVSSRVVVDHNICDSTGDDGVAVVGYQANASTCSDITIAHNISRNSAARGFAVLGCAGGRVYGNTALTPAQSGVRIGSDAAYSTYGCSDIQVIGNTVSGSVSGSIGSINVTGDATYPNDRIDIKHNTITSSGYRGITLVPTTAATNNNVTIESNRIHTTVSEGIYAESVLNLVISRNHIVDTGSRPIIALTAGLSSGVIEVIGNTIINGNTAMTAANDGIQISTGGTPALIVVSNNVIHDPNGYLDRGIECAHSGAVMVGNFLDNGNGVLGTATPGTHDIYAAARVQGSLTAGYLGNGGWNAGHLLIGTYHLWVDSTGDLRIKSSAPASDTDGTVVGTQT